MAESNLPTHTEISKQEEAGEAESYVSTITIDDVMINFGLKEFFGSLLVALAYFIDAQQSFISIFTDAQPLWHCTNHTTTCTSKTSNICNIPRSSWTWDQRSHTTIISQWELQCASSFITGLPQSSFFIGCFFGGFVLATLADSSLGRKNLLLLSCFAMSIVSLLASLISFNVWIYSALKFLLGFFRSSVGTCTLVLLVEKVGRKWRFRVGILAFVCFSTGFLSLPAMAYLNRDSSWTFLYLWSSIIGLCYSVCVHFFVSESPRWLIMQGREEEALRILKGIVPQNGGDAKLASRLLELPPKQEAFSNSGGMYSSIGRIFGKDWSIKRISAVMVLAFGIGMVYFGMPLGVGNLDFNIYLGVALNALLEMPTYVVTYLLENSKRRISLLSFTTLSGVFSMLLCGGVVVVSLRVEALKMVLELASFFCACCACNVILIYTMELFPTSVRNTATALVRQAMVLGAIFGPVLASEGRKSDLLSYGVFGGVIMVCGFCVAFLPETHGTILCDTMDQQENKESSVEV